MSKNSISAANRFFNGLVAALTWAYPDGSPTGIECHLFQRFRPTGNRAVTFTGNPAAGDTTETLTGNWNGPTGFFPLTLPSGRSCVAYLINGSTAVALYLAPPRLGQSPGPVYALPAAETAATAVVGDTPPVLGVANAFSLTQAVGAAAKALLNGATYVFNGVAIPDVPRNVVAAWTTASNITVVGTDVYGNVQSEVLATPGGSVGKKAFATVTSITSSASITAFTAGFGAVLGLPIRVPHGEFFSPMLNDAADATTFTPPDLTNPATTTTGDTRGTVTATGALDGVKYFSCLIRAGDNRTQFGAFGQLPV